MFAAMAAVSSGNDVAASRTMESLKPSANSVAPYRLPSRHPSADARDRDSSRDNARAGSAPAASKPTTFAAENASAIKRRQEALLIAYLVRLAR
ncbi:MAG: hypothetical protein ABI580_13960 [Burkholderiaceae bacterium]